MKIYITSEPKKKLKSIFINLKFFHIISVDNLIKRYNIDITRPTSAYLLYEMITRDIERISSSKFIKGIIYSYSAIDEEIIYNLEEYIKYNDYLDSLVLLDGDNQKHINLYKCFSEILYIPSAERVKILECKPMRY